MRSSRTPRRDAAAAGRPGFAVGLGSSLIVAWAGAFGAALAPTWPVATAPIWAVSAFAVPALGAWPQTAQAQVNRCTTDRGTVVFTDRPCAAIGANERLPRAAAVPGNGGLRRAGCARNLQDLMYEITSAIDQRDVNRLGGVYHWVGMSAQSGERVLDRLQAIVDRPLVDIVALRGGGTPRPAPEAASAAAETSASPASADAPGGSAASSATPTAAAPLVDPALGESAPPPPAPRRGGPVGLRLEQTLRGSATPSRTVFGLRRHLDCWWVVLPN